MPYAVTTFEADTGFATYKLGQSEAFTPLAASFLLDHSGATNDYGYPVAEWRDAIGGLIYRQTFNTILKDGVYVSMAAEAEPWYISNAGAFGLPQDTDQQFNATMSVRMPRVPLTPGCTFAIYVLRAALSADDDPMDYLSTNFIVSVPHLWVEDTEPGLHFGPVGNPVLLGVGA